MTNLQRRVKIVQCFSISSRELHSARAAVGDMASKSGGARDRLIFGNHFARLFRCKITPAAVVCINEIKIHYLAQTKMVIRHLLFHSETWKHTVISPRQKPIRFVRTLEILGKFLKRFYELPLCEQRITVPKTWNIPSSHTQCKCSPGPKVEKAGSRRSEGHTFWGDILVSGRHSVSLGKAKCALDLIQSFR